MVDLHESSGSELDSDEELQAAFARGELKPGLNVAVQQKTVINNAAGLKQKLNEFQQSLDWIERLDETSQPAPAPAGAEEETEAEEDNLANNDFKRELKLYRQAQAAVLIGIPRLHKLGIKTKRPDDYFAEMAKSDDHMKKVREKLLQKKTTMEHREKAKKLRDLRKYGKKVQIEVLQKRQKEKREMLEAVKKYRKGQKDKLDFLDDKEQMKAGPGKAKGNKPGNKPGNKSDSKPHIINKRREYKDKKFGHGGQKKRSKMNTKESANDMSTFNPRINQSKAKGKSKATQRPGKSKRHANKNKKRH